MKGGMWRVKEGEVASEGGGGGGGGDVASEGG